MAGRNSAWALIKDGIVMNTIDCKDGYYMANILARSSFGDEAYAIDINQYMCGMNDLYKNGTFYYINEETGEEIAYPRLPTDQEEISLFNSLLTESQLALTEQYEANLALQTEVTNTQLALAELYEEKGV